MSQAATRGGIFLQPHLGLGDHILCGGLVRELARRRGRVTLPCKHHNFVSVRHLHREDDVSVVPVAGDDEASRLALAQARAGGQVLRLGEFGHRFLSRAFRFDEHFYWQADVDFEERWRSFVVPPHEDEERVFNEAVSRERYAFFHDDPSRGYSIERVPSLPLVRPNPRLTNCIFGWRRVIERASEIHCIDSAFLCWIDSFPEDGKPLYWHRYARRHEDARIHPTLRRPWQILE